MLAFFVRRLIGAVLVCIAVTLIVFLIFVLAPGGNGLATAQRIAGKNATPQNVANIELCGDADDLFLDPKRQHIYVSCGQGVLDVFDTRYRRLARLPTATGARTSYFVPSVDRLFLAVRSTLAEPAAIWVFRPAP